MSFFTNEFVFTTESQRKAKIRRQIEKLKEFED